MNSRFKLAVTNALPTDGKTKAFQEVSPPKTLGVSTLPNFRLDVAHVVHRRDLPTFYDSGFDLVKIIESTGELSLVASAWEASDDYVRIYNYWGLNNGVSSLLSAELKLPDEPIFIQFDRLMVSETKDLVFPLTSASVTVPKIAQPNEFAFLRAEYQLASSQLAEFSARVEADLLSFGGRNGWYLGESYLNLTGRSGHVVQTWIVPQQTAATAQQLLMTTKWQAMLDATVKCSVLQPFPSCPILGVNRTRSSMLT